MDERELHDKGMTVRRAVLGDAHVDRATAQERQRGIPGADNTLRLGEI
jgi:4-carboxymuconolactone decarboxylase